MRSEEIKLRDKIRKQIYNSRPEVKQRLIERNLMKNYGLTIQEHQKLQESQNYQCKICKKHKKDCNKLGLVVDHNHKTGNVRSLLCNDCNLIIGHAKDSVDILKKCISYLEEELNNVS